MWLRACTGRLVRAGACPTYVRTSVEAELAAIHAGVWLAATRFGDEVCGVSVRSDCQGALALAEPDAPLARRKSTRRLQELIRETVEAHGVELDLRWVRGHQRAAAGTSAWLNNRCDKLAKAHSSLTSKPKKKRKSKSRRRKDGPQPLPSPA